MQADNLYDILFDSNGVVRQNNQKVILRDFNLLGNGGKNAPVILQVDQNEQLASLKFNKQLKVVNLVPEFKSVPATSHLFDLVSSHLEYPELTS